MLASQFPITDLPKSFHIHYNSGLPWKFHQFYDGHWDIHMSNADLQNYHNSINFPTLHTGQNAKRHLFITISFPNGNPLLSIQASLKKVLKKCWISKKTYFYTYEQRFDGTTAHKKLGDGIHVHLLLLDTKKAKSQAIREIASTLSITRNYVDVRVGKLASLAEVRLNYIKGLKKQSKLGTVHQDLKWRKENNLQPYYTNGTKTQTPLPPKQKQTQVGPIGPLP